MQKRHDVKTFETSRELLIAKYHTFVLLKSVTYILFDYEWLRLKFLK